MTTILLGVLELRLILSLKPRSEVDPGWRGNEGSMLWSESMMHSRIGRRSSQHVSRRRINRGSGQRVFQRLEIPCPGEEVCSGQGETFIGL